MKAHSADLALQALDCFSLFIGFHSHLAVQGTALGPIHWKEAVLQFPCMAGWPKVPISRESVLWCFIFRIGEGLRGHTSTDYKAMAAICHHLMRWEYSFKVLLIKVIFITYQTSNKRNI